MQINYTKLSQKIKNKVLIGFGNAKNTDQLLGAWFQGNPKN